MKHRKTIPRVLPVLLSMALLISFCDRVAAQDWPQFRGPDLNGSSESKPLPADWSTTRGLDWRVELPGPSAATPAVSGGRVFLTAVDSKSGELLALCLGAADGGELWRRPMGMNRRVALNSLSAPSPATDGKVVAFMFGTGVLVVFDVEGKELWRRDLTAEQGELTMKFAPSSSLLLHEGTLYVQALRRPEPYRKNAPKADPLPSFLMAIDPQTGKNRWFHERPTDAVQESHDSYVTPIPWRRAGRLEIVAIGGDSVTGHDAGDGRELWRWNFNPEKRKNWRVVPTPVVRGDTLFFVEPRGNALVALKPEGEGLQKSEPLWRLDQDAPDVCSLLLYNNSLYVLEGDRRVMSRIDPESGKVLWRGTLGDSSLFRSSPTAGDGKIYAINEQGRVFVLDAGDEFRALSEIEMGGKEVRASIVIANKRLFIRTNEALYCVGGEARK